MSVYLRTAPLAMPHKGDISLKDQPHKKSLTIPTTKTHRKALQRFKKPTKSPLTHPAAYKKAVEAPRSVVLAVEPPHVGFMKCQCVVLSYEG